MRQGPARQRQSAIKLTQPVCPPTFLSATGSRRRRRGTASRRGGAVQSTALANDNTDSVRIRVDRGPTPLFPGGGK